MARYKNLYLYFSIFIFSLFVFNSVFAAGLVPCGGKNEPACTFCHLFKMGGRILRYLMEITVVLAVGFIVFGGVMMMLAGDSPQKVQNAKNIIFGAVIGIIIMLASWIILSTFFHLMVGGFKEGFQWPWYEIDCRL